jgi:hypothetical protein
MLYSYVCVDMQQVCQHIYSYVCVPQYMLYTYICVPQYVISRYAAISVLGNTYIAIYVFPLLYMCSLCYVCVPSTIYVFRL